MNNYYLNYKKEILAIAKRHDVDGCANGQPQLKDACDIFDNNARTVVEGHGTFVECGVPKTNKEFWAKARNYRKAVDTVKELTELQHKFVKAVTKK